jgi:hypothetical protein
VPSDPPVENDRIEVEAPLDPSLRSVFRLVAAGVAEQASFGFEELDDLQLAIERLLAEAGSHGRVRISFEVTGEGIRTRLGPLPEGRLAEALQEPDGDPGALTLNRILSTVVDSFGVDHAEDGQIVVRLEKLLGIPRR